MKKLNDPLAWIGENNNKDYAEYRKLLGLEDIVTKEQVRKDFNEERLKELADSIKQHGIIEPLIVAEAKEDKFLLIAGERRFRAAKIAGLAAVPCIIKYNIKEEDIIIIQLIENGQREDLNSVELNAVYQKLQDSGLSIRGIAEKIGKSKSHVQEVLSISKLNAEEKVSAGRTLKKAVELSKIKNESQRKELIEKDNISAKEIRKARQEAEKAKDKKQDEFNGGIESTRILLDSYAEKKIGKEPEQKDIETDKEPDTGVQEVKVNPAEYFNMLKDEDDKVNQIVSLEDKIMQFNSLHNNIIVELGKPKDIKTHNLPPMQTGEAAVIKIAFKSQNLANDLINILNKSFPVK